MTDYERGFADCRERIIPVIRRFLQFDSQRAVSWHEVNDCIDAIRALTPTPTEKAPACATCFGGGTITVPIDDDHAIKKPCPDCRGGSGRAP